MSASEVAPNPFWYAKSIAALTSRDRLSICVLVMFAHESVKQLSVTRISKPVKPPACFSDRKAQTLGDRVFPRLLEHRRALYTKRHLEVLEKAAARFGASVRPARHGQV